MTKRNQPITKPTMDVMKPRRSGERGWQLNLREQLPEQAPRFVLDLREPAAVKDQRFFEVLPIDAFSRRPDGREAWDGQFDDELDIDEKLALWWQDSRRIVRRLPAQVAADAAAVWLWIRGHLPSRRPVSVVFAAAVLAAIGVLVAETHAVNPATRQGVAPPGRGGAPLIGALPQTGAGGWLAILENYLNQHYSKLSPETRAVPSPVPGAPAPVTQAQPATAAPLGGAIAPAAGGVTQPLTEPVQNAPAPVSQPAPVTQPVPVTQPLQPVTQPLSQPLQPVTQPVQQLTQPVTGGLGL